MLLLIACKGLAYGTSLSTFHGGPVFPGMFVGAAGGVALSHLPGLAMVAGAAMGIGAMTCAMLGLPLTSVLLATLFLGSDGRDRHAPDHRGRGRRLGPAGPISQPDPHPYPPKRPSRPPQLPHRSSRPALPPDHRSALLAGESADAARREPAAPTLWPRRSLMTRRNRARFRNVGHDLVAGSVLGIESVPDGLATGLLAGVNPLAGVYGYMVGTATGA